MKTGRPGLKLNWWPKLSAVPCSPRTTQGGHGSLTIHLEVKPARGNASNVSQLATGPKSAKKNPLVHAQSANEQVIGSGTVPSPKGEGELLLLRWPCCMTEAALGFCWLPAMRCLSPSRSPGWSLMWQVRKPVFNWHRSHLLCPALSLWASFLQKLYSDWCQRKALHLFLHWASHLPIWAAFNLTWLFSCAWVSYHTTGERPSGVPWSHITIRRSQAVLTWDLTLGGKRSYKYVCRLKICLLCFTCPCSYLERKRTFKCKNSPVL